jgi:hypothetical protein
VSAQNAGKSIPPLKKGRIPDGRRFKTPCRASGAAFPLRNQFIKKDNSSLTGYIELGYSSKNTPNSYDKAKNGLAYNLL